MAHMLEGFGISIEPDSDRVRQSLRIPELDHRSDIPGLRGYGPGLLSEQPGQCHAAVDAWIFCV